MDNSEIYINKRKSTKNKGGIPTKWHISRPPIVKRTQNGINS